MDIFYLILAGLVVGFALLIPIKRPEEHSAAESTNDYSPEVWDILMGVYTKLRQARVSCRPWIHDCIVAIEAGRGCDPEIALAALTETGEDLAGTRWDTDKMAETFGEAAEKLAAMI